MNPRRRIRGRRSRRAGRDGPAQHHVEDRQRHHQQHAQDGGARFDRDPAEDVVGPRGDDPHEEHRRHHRPELGEPADDGAVLAVAADQRRDRRAHLPDRPQDDEKSREREENEKEIERRRIDPRVPRTPPRPLETPQMTARDGEPAQLRAGRSANGSRRSSPAVPEQESGEEPGDPHGDDRDEKFDDRDPAQTMSLPEREEDRERGQREDEDAAEVERDAHAASEGPRGERFVARRRKPHPVFSERAIVQLLDPPADEEHPDDEEGEERQHRRAVGLVELGDDLLSVAGNAKNASLNSREPLAHHAGVPSTIPDIALSPLAFAGAADRSS